MIKTRSRLLSLLLVLAMVVTMLPVSAFAKANQYFAQSNYVVTSASLTPGQASIKKLRSLLGDTGSTSTCYFEVDTTNSSNPEKCSSEVLDLPNMKSLEAKSNDATDIFLGWYFQDGTLFSADAYVDLYKNRSAGQKNMQKLTSKGKSTENYYVYALFAKAAPEVEKVEITYVAAPGGTVVLNDGVSTAPGATASETFEVIPSATPYGATAAAADGYEFVGWYDNAEGDGDAFSTEVSYSPAVYHLIGDDGTNKDAVTFYAVFAQVLQQDTASITYEAVPEVGGRVKLNDSVSTAAPSVTEPYGGPNDTSAPKGATAEALKGYSFKGWYNNAEGTGSAITTDALINPSGLNLGNGNNGWTLYEDVTYYAVFEAAQQASAPLTFKVVPEEAAAGVYFVGDDASTAAKTISQTSASGASPKAVRMTNNDAENWKFVGWYKDGELVTEDTGPLYVVGWPETETVYEARFEEKKFDIVYKNEADERVSSSTFSYGAESVTLKGALDSLAKENYTQIGWTTTIGGEKEYDLGQKNLAPVDLPFVNDVLTLYPVYQGNPYEIVYYDENGERASSSNARYGEEVILKNKLDSLDKDYYTQLGWATEKNGAKVFEFGQRPLKDTDFTIVDGKVALYPVYKPIPVDVTFKKEVSNGTAGLDDLCGFDIIVDGTERGVGGTNGVLAATIDDDKIEAIAKINNEDPRLEFLGWFDGDTPIVGADGEILKTLTLMRTAGQNWTENKTYTAKFIEVATITYQVAEDPKYDYADQNSPAGTVTVDIEKVYWDQDAQVGSEAQAKPGMKFVGWYQGTELVSEEATFVPTVPNGGWNATNSEFAAKFEYIPYTVSFEFTGPAPEDAAVPNMVENKYVGQIVELPDVDVPIGYEFEWVSVEAVDETYTGGDVEIKDGGTVKMPWSNIVVTGHWKKYTLDVIKSLDGDTAPADRTPEFIFDVQLGTDPAQELTIDKTATDSASMLLDIAKLREGKKYTVTERNLIDGNFDWAFDATEYTVELDETGEKIVVTAGDTVKEYAIGADGATAEAKFTNTYYEPNLTLVIHKDTKGKLEDTVFYYGAQLGYWSEGGEFDPVGEMICMSGTSKIDAVLKLDYDQIDHMYDGAVIMVWEKDTDLTGWTYDESTYALALDILRDENKAYLGRELVVVNHDTKKVVGKAALVESEASVEITFVNTYKNKPTIENYPVVPTQTTIAVRKVWSGVSQTPASAQVQLYRNGRAYGDPVTLSAKTGWAHIWTGLDTAYTWAVDEVNVPAGFARSVSVDGSIWTITNTYVGAADAFVTAPGATILPGVPKTGDTTNFSMWIVLAVLAMAGLLGAVVVIRRKNRA